MRWFTLLATAAALAPKDDKQLALWLLEPSRTIDEVRAGAETLAARPPTQPCDALALCMASWAASQKQQGDLLPKLAAKLAPRLSEAVDSPRCAEVLSNTARAFAVRDQRLALRGDKAGSASMACRADAIAARVEGKDTGNTRRWRRPGPTRRTRSRGSSRRSRRRVAVSGSR